MADGLPGAERTTRRVPNTQEEALGSRVQEGGWPEGGCSGQRGPLISDQTEPGRARPSGTVSRAWGALRGWGCWAVGTETQVLPCRAGGTPGASVLCSQIWPPQGRQRTSVATWDGPQLPGQRPGPAQPSRPSTQSPREQSHRQACVLAVSSLRRIHGDSGQAPSRAASPAPCHQRQTWGGCSIGRTGTPPLS